METSGVRQMGHSARALAATCRAQCTQHARWPQLAKSASRGRRRHTQHSSPSASTSPTAAAPTPAPPSSIPLSRIGHEGMRMRMRARARARVRARVYVCIHARGCAHVRQRWCVRMRVRVHLCAHAWRAAAPLSPGARAVVARRAIVVIFVPLQRVGEVLRGRRQKRWHRVLRGRRQKRWHRAHGCAWSIRTLQARTRVCVSVLASVHGCACTCARVRACPRINVRTHLRRRTRVGLRVCVLCAISVLRCHRRRTSAC